MVPGVKITTQWLSGKVVRTRCHGRAREGVGALPAGRNPLDWELQGAESTAAVVTSRTTPAQYRNRPRDFDPGLAETITERIANGEQLTAICAHDRDMPAPATFLRWVRDDPHLASAYEEALAMRCDVLVEEMLELSSGEDPRTARVEVDARRFVVERLMPEKYGPRTYATLRERTDDHAGVDHAAEVRRRLAEMAKRMAAAHVPEEA